MSVRENIADGLKEFRKRSGLSADEVGAALGKSGKTIYAWETGRGQPDGDELIKLCKLLDAHIEDFYGSEFRYCVVDMTPEDELSEVDKELISLLKKLEEHEKFALVSVAESFIEHRGDGTIPLISRVELHGREDSMYVELKERSHSDRGLL